VVAGLGPVRVIVKFEIHGPLTVPDSEQLVVQAGAVTVTVVFCVTEVPARLITVSV
jgi:hypothetical protein